MPSSLALIAKTYLCLDLLLHVHILQSDVQISPPILICDGYKNKSYWSTSYLADIGVYILDFLFLQKRV